MSLNIRVFDTILSSDRKGDSVSRNSADFWKAFCNASGWGFNFERIHSIEDIRYFFCNTKIKEEIIIFSGHGQDENSEDILSGFHLSNGDVLVGKHDFQIPKKNHDKTFIFSSCLIGKNDILSEDLKNFFNAQCLFSYQHEMYDQFCFLFESILLTLISRNFNKERAFGTKDFDEFKEHTNILKNINMPNVKNHPMRMF